MSGLENFLEGMFLVMLIAALWYAALEWLGRWAQVRELMSIAKKECGPYFETYKREIKWQCKLRARSIRAGMDAGTQRAALRSYLREYCMADGYLREIKRHG